MNQIEKQVSKARRRIMTGKFFRILSWAAFAGLLIAVVGLLIPKIWHLSFLDTQDKNDAWVYSWTLGGVVVAFFTAALLTLRNRTSTLAAAVEVDRRFGLKERLSSAMTLTSADRNSTVGQALVEDAEHRAEAIDVRDQFRYQPKWTAAMPLLPLLMLIGLVFIPNAAQPVAANEPAEEARKRVKVAVKEFQKKVEEKRQQLEAKGLKDADETLKSLGKKFDKLLDDKSGDQKQAMVELNDIKKQIEDRRKALGDSKELRESLNKLKDASSGPAKELADALSKGEIKEATQAIKELAKKLKSGKLSEVEKKQLAKDLQAMAKELKKMADKHEAEKRKLEEQIKKAVENGDLDKAAKLQQQLDQKKQLDKQKEKLKKMAEQMKKAAEAMQSKQGQPQPGSDGEKQPGESDDAKSAERGQQEAGESLEDLAQQMEQMQRELEEMDALEDLENMAQEAKENLAKGADGQGKHDEQNWQDFAKGEGPGGGKRELEQEDTGSFRARVKAKLQQGETVVTGNADGKNITGRSVSEVRELIRSSISKDTDPLEDQRLSRTQREHAQQYFEALRKNE